jgi:hypothetical protein
MKSILFFVLLLVSLAVEAQIETTKSPLTISGYAEVYYLYDFARPQDNTRPNFVYAFNRHHEVNLNLGYLKAAYDNGQVRGNVAFMTGTYANANLAAEPGVLRNILEANVGAKISQKHNLWIDAGIFASHIGFESAVGKDCWNLTRSLMADNSPYFESGAKITYTTDDGKWLVSGLVLNGWQRIQRVPGNSTPAFGHQITYKPTVRLTLNSSSFVGNDKPDSTRQMRYFYNFYGIFQATEKLGITFGFDVGAEQMAKKSSKYNWWYTPVVIVRLKTSEKTALAARAEYYSDANGVIISTNTPNGFWTWGYSLNFDYALSDNALWRVEARGFSSKDAIFGAVPTRQNQLLATSLSLSF